MIKCIYRTDIEVEQHCDKPADYIYLGKSYCAEHMEVRSKEQEKAEKRFDGVYKVTEK